MTKSKLPPLEIPEENKVYNFDIHQSWGISDPERFYKLMGEATSLVLSGHYLGDNLFTWQRNNSLLEDGAFRTSWQSNALNIADQAIAWRRYILCCAACHCIHLDGAFVECGTLHGTGIKTVIDYFGKDKFDKLFYGYDTFDTNPVEGHQFPGQHEGLYEVVQQRFADYHQVKLVTGMLPQSLEGNSPEKIAYLHIDLNYPEYEIAVLDALFERVVAGGIIILDDYEWSGPYRRQKILEDQWFSSRDYRVFPLPTGQGLVIKRP